jgi:hypothetical protein
VRLYIADLLIIHRETSENPEIWTQTYTLFGHMIIGAQREQYYWSAVPR